MWSNTREGDDLRNTPRKLAGLTKFGNVTPALGRVRRFRLPRLGIRGRADQHRAPLTGMIRHNVTIT